MLNPSRLDLIVKLLFFQSLLGGRDGNAQRLYERHIARRTGGFEDGKRSTSDYVNAAVSLLDSLRSRGFDPACPVRMGARNGLPLDGAHRLAAARALGIEPVVEMVPGRWGGTWDFEWFRQRAFPQDDLDEIVRTYARHTPRGMTFVFWAPTRSRWDDMLACLRDRAQVVGWTDLAVEEQDLQTLVEDIYAFRLGPLANPRIQDKGRALAEHPPVMRVVFAEAPAEGELERLATEVKHRLRAIGGAGREDFWTTVHATDSAEEARYVVNLLFNPNYRRLLPTRRQALRPQFLEWLEHYRCVLDESRIDRNDACIVGSSVLEAVGVRDSTDIDCIVGCRAPRFHGGVVKLGRDVDLVSAGYHRRADGGPTWSDADVIADPLLHFYVRGFKFANPELVIDRKRQHGRPKDLADVRLWDARPQSRADTTLTGTVVHWSTAPLDVVRQTALEERRRRLAGDGIALIVAGVPAAPATAPALYIEAPPPVDRVPVELLIEHDPCDTLADAGVPAEALLDRVAAEHGAPTDPGHAFRRLRALAWTARWMRGWLGRVRPAEVTTDDDGAEAMLLRALAQQIQPLYADVNVRRLDEACRGATEQARLACAAMTETYRSR